MKQILLQASIRFKNTWPSILIKPLWQNLANALALRQMIIWLDSEVRRYEE